MNVGDVVWYGDSLWTLVKKEMGGWYIEQPSRGKSIHRTWVSPEQLKFLIPKRNDE